MPIYTYICMECGKEEEILCGINDKLKMICCDKSMRKKFGAAMLEFRGHGFHSTDYKRLENIRRDANKHVKKEDPSLHIDRQLD